MNTRTKYLIINLLVFIPIVAIVYLITKSPSDGGSVSATIKQRFLSDTDEVQRLYSQFKQSVETNDLSQREQDKVNLKQQLSIMETTYGHTSTFGKIAEQVNQNYQRLITLNETASSNGTAISAQKEELKKLIQGLETENQGLQIRLAILQSQPVPAP